MQRKRSAVALCALYMAFLFALAGWRAPAAYAAGTPGSISLDKSTISMMRYGTVQLRATVSPASATQTVKWKSSKTSVATVSSAGVVTAKAAGKATITCYSAKSSKIYATAVVTVSQKANPKSISLTPATSIMTVGETLQLNAAPSPAGSCDVFTWKSSSSSRASVTDGGLVTAKKAGTVTITCTSRQATGVRVTRKITIVSAASPYSITLSASKVTLNPGATEQLSASALPAGRSQAFTWRTSKSSVATVNEYGVITAKKVGTATITAASKVNSNIKATVAVTVAALPAPTKLSVSPASATLQKGTTSTLFVSALPIGSDARISWSSSNTSVASVSSAGVVTAKKPGAATITAISAANKRVTATARLTVTDAKSPASIALSAATLSLEPTQAATVTACALPAAANQSIKWSSGNTSVAKVSSSGVVTALRSGTAIITATSGYNCAVSASLRVTVLTKTAPSALVASAPAALKIRPTAQLAGTTNPATASRLYSYASSNSSVLSVNSSGLVTAKKAGTAVVTVKSTKKTSVSARVAIVVGNDLTPKSIALSSASVYLGEADRVTLTPTVLPATANQAVTWKSTNTSVATVTASGQVTAMGVGTATILCTTQAGSLSASCSIQVLKTTLTTLIPARTTATADIAANLARIDAIRLSAVNQVLSLRGAGSVTASEASARQLILNRAFAMQAFPWMTKNVQEYWTPAYAYKRYLPGNVYYGLPYIQTGKSNGYLNRRYDAAKALDEKRYTNSGAGYYLLNQDNLLDGMYVGNDCSAFVSISQWGTAHTASYLNTTAIAQSSYYKTVSGGYALLRPGDLLVHSGDHTALFLYYTDASRSKMMIIEQGGDGSTVICSVYNTTWFSSRGYIIRRKLTFA